jgi:hypothetical protein
MDAPACPPGLPTRGIRRLSDKGHLRESEERVTSDVQALAAVGASGSRTRSLHHHGDLADYDVAKAVWVAMGKRGAALEGASTLERVALRGDACACKASTAASGSTSAAVTATAVRTPLAADLPLHRRDQPATPGRESSPTRFNAKRRPSVASYPRFATPRSSGSRPARRAVPKGGAAQRSGLDAGGGACHQPRHLITPKPA